MTTNCLSRIYHRFYPKEKESEADAFIRKSNSAKGKDALAVVILQTSHDHNKAFDQNKVHFLAGLDVVGKTHYIYKAVLGDADIGKALREAKAALGERKIMLLWVRGHGLPDRIICSHDDAYMLKDVKKEDYALLDPKARLFFDSCSTGALNGIARRVAQVQPRRVYAPTQPIDADCFAVKGKQIEWEALQDGCIPVGTIYQKDRIVKPLTSTILQDRRKRALQGSYNDQIATVKYYLSLAKKYPKNRSLFKQAIRFLELAAEKSVGAEQALMQYALDGAYNKIPKESVFHYFEKMAKTGDLDALLALGDCYRRGWGVARNDQLAIENYKKLIASKPSEETYRLRFTAEERLAGCYETLHGADSLLALIHYLKSITVPHPSESALAGVKRVRKQLERASVTEALAWFKYHNLNELERLDLTDKERFEHLEVAASMHNYSAYYLLGRYYEEGKGVKRSYEKAKSWYTKAANTALDEHAALARKALIDLKS